MFVHKDSFGVYKVEEDFPDMSARLSHQMQEHKRGARSSPSHLSEEQVFVYLSCLCVRASFEFGGKMHEEATSLLSTFKAMSGRLWILRTSLTRLTWLGHALMGLHLLSRFLVSSLV